jgi:NAD(P)-dependent dehydrogenase (short-subunit alcohol dehydrogenase family)
VPAACVQSGVPSPSNSPGPAATSSSPVPADHPRTIRPASTKIEALGRRALPVVSNIADPGAVDDLVALAIKQFGRLDIVVNNAGAARGEDRKPVVDLDFDTWQNVLDVNLNGTFLLSRAAARHWLATETPGSIVNISSVGGKIAGPGTAAYSASKAAIHALGAAMAAELGPSGIRVNAICPGVVDTSRLDDIDRGEHWNRLLNIIPMRRHGTGEDIAHMVVYLCSEQGSWITGQAINVDGGQLTIR